MRLLPGCVALLLLSAPARGAGRGVTKESVNYLGRERVYHLYAPAKPYAARRAPLSR